MNLTLAGKGELFKRIVICLLFAFEHQTVITVYSSMPCHAIPLVLNKFWFVLKCDELVFLGISSSKLRFRSQQMIAMPAMVLESAVCRREHENFKTKYLRCSHTNDSVELQLDHKLVRSY